MELAVVLGALGLGSLGNVGTVAQLLGSAGGLISKISNAAETARQNKVECVLLASRLSTIGGVLSLLPHGPEVARPLSELNNKLEEAHGLVVACQKRSAVNQLFGASRRAERFKEVNARITSDISVVNLSLLSYIANSERRQYVSGLISMISKAAETARQNKVDCKLLASRMSTIGALLSRLKPDPEVAPPLAELNNTLQEAHALVVACQKRSAINQLFRASRRADMFREMNTRIDSDISVLNLSLQIAHHGRRKYLCSFNCFPGMF